MDKRFEAYARLAAIVFLVAGCLIVLRPFLPAVLFAAAVTISSWPVYLWLLDRMKARRTLAALTMSLTLTLLVIVPLALVTYNLADDVARVYEHVRVAVDAGHVEPPLWLKEIPLVGDALERYLRQIMGSREEMMTLAKRMLEPAKNVLMGGGLILGSGLAQTSLAVFVSFFLYRDGQQMLAALAVALERVIGERAAQVANIVNRTVRGVMYGLLGTALAQALVAALGFMIAGVPAVPLLSVGTFLFSLVPVGPPIIWGSAAVWLFNQGQTGWAIFMLVWGIFLISGVDNVVKPYLISRGSRLPFLLVLLGVLGGVLAFGFVGLFIGPTLLAIGFSLARDFTARADPG